MSHNLIFCYTLQYNLLISYFDFWYSPCGTCRIWCTTQYNVFSEIKSAIKSFKSQVTTSLAYKSQANVVLCTCTIIKTVPFAIRYNEHVFEKSKLVVKIS